VSPRRGRHVTLGPRVQTLEQCLRCSTLPTTVTAYTLITTAPFFKHVFCGLSCLIDWVSSEKGLESINAARSARALEMQEELARLLVVSGAVEHRHSEEIDSLVDDLFLEFPGVDHTPMSFCAKCGEPRPIVASFIVLSPGMAGGRGARYRRILCSLRCLTASLRADVERLKR
jgi:hypothetical protein